MKHLSVLGASFLDGAVISERVYALIQFAENAMSSVKRIMVEWSSRVNGRKDLARLTVRQLTDIGLEPYQVQAEINKPFWKK